MKRVKKMLIAWAALTIPCISSAANYNPAYTAGTNGVSVSGSTI